MTEEELRFERFEARFAQAHGWEYPLREAVRKTLFYQLSHVSFLFREFLRELVRPILEKLQ